jgi:7-keto-8-aminopelargonate synthetase-like enzyme
MSDFDFIKNELNELKKTDLLRSPVCIDSAHGTVIRIGNDKKVLFCSNNYLTWLEMSK